MSDLISRSELLKRLEEWNTSDEMDKALYNFAFNRIIEQPTAYDIDKVVEQLEELKMRYFLTIANTGDEKSDFAYENVGNSLDKAIEIVKQGCVSDDVCEWIKYDYRTICPKDHDANNPYWRIPDNMDKLKYCPYCKKR